MAVIQLDFWEETEISILKSRMDKCEASGHKVRKGTYAEIGAIKKESHEEIAMLKKQISELKENVDLLIRNICNGK
jgi:hypothetical protein